MILIALLIEQFWTVNTYENIALTRLAWQRHPYHGTPWAARLAVDGRQSDLSARGGQCAISANGQSEAEWRVDLGDVRNLHHVFIQYRTDNIAWDKGNAHTDRFIGFSIYVSNTTYRKDWKLCFKDNNYTKATIPNPISVTCLIHGRYVIYHNNRTHRPFPAGYSTYAFNDLCEVEVYENIALDRPAWQRYPFHDTPWNATYAVDGRRSDLAPAGGQCAISADRKSIAEWRVDLGEVRNLHHVFIQYRTDNDASDQNDYFKSRFLGFSIYVSNTTYRKDWKLCFKDNNYTRATIPNPISVTCLMHGRYVIYYNNRTHRPFPAGYSTYAFNDLCEVEVYENIALHRHAWQRYPFHGTPWNATYAVDGRRSDLDPAGGQCAISADGKSIAEWRVDLGEVRNLHHVFIQYRTDNVAWDENDYFKSRVLGFSIYVSNTTHRNDWRLCFKDNNYTRATIPNPISVTCLMHGRYVIYYNNRTHWPFPAGYSTYAFNDLCEVDVYENIALNRPAWQRYPFHGTPWNATHAVDGHRSDLAPAGGQCAISADGKSIAEWRVDLGEVRNLHHVFIQYRTDNDAWDQNDYFKSRFLGFSIYVSNTTYRKDWKLCFKDNNYTRATIPNPISVTCLMHGRYVIYYNNRTHRPFPAGYSTYAFNDLCEVEVYGCLTLGYYGENCSTPCPENCKGGDCDIVDGTCISCVPGYSGSMCNIVCTNNTYGPNCSMTCGHCLYLYGEKCNHVTGQCPRGCASGFQGDLCVESRSEFRNTTLAWSTSNATDKFKNKTLVRPMNDGCLTLGYYGENCSTPCPENCKGGDCDNVDGTCVSCVPGYSGSMCNIVCGACYEKEQCDYKNGTCPNGCEDGYKGRQCKTVCNNNTYGPNCSMTCGHCLYLYGEKCNHVTGQCPRGCVSGFQGDLCVESRSEFRNTTLAWSTSNATDKFKNKTLVRPMNDAYGPPVLQTTVQVPFYSIITVVVLFSVSALLNLFFISRQVLARCRNREEKVDESVEQPNTIVNSIYIQENGFSTYQELEHADQKENNDVYTSLA
ncbi:uncharacterized protein [Magallana gigas]|uniref:uncharacterized protein isoform X4 n=1 Tax=Magallana gigas TaxID=29159 RepID=UPI00333F26BF